MGLEVKTDGRVVASTRLNELADSVVMNERAIAQLRLNATRIGGLSLDPTDSGQFSLSADDNDVLAAGSYDLANNVLAAPDLSDGAQIAFLKGIPFDTVDVGGANYIKNSSVTSDLGFLPAAVTLSCSEVKLATTGIHRVSMGAMTLTLRSVADADITISAGLIQMVADLNVLLIDPAAGAVLPKIFGRLSTNQVALSSGTAAITVPGIMIDIPAEISNEASVYFFLTYSQAYSATFSATPDKLKLTAGITAGTTFLGAA